MKSIPLYKMDEHHEAFLIWHDAIKKNYLTPTGNALLHVDQHSDMMEPVLRTPINDLRRSKEEFQRFTYDELGIGDFIYPAVYTGIFHTVYWVLQPDGVSQPKPVKEFVLSTYQNEGRIFIINQASASAPGSVSFMRHDLTIKESIKPTQPLVLDIDIDYFSCETYQNKPIRLEITREQFDQFNNNKYHPLRFEYKCYTKQVADQYFLIFNQSVNIVIRPDAKVSKPQILKRIDSFRDWLISNQIDPVITEICRDTYAGFIPDDQREFTEKNLVKKLESIYDFQLVSFE